VKEDLDTRRKLAKEGRLYLLSLACATPGGIAVYLSNSVAVGVVVFLCCVLVFGSALWAYERRLSKQRQHKR
jgi:hypothetical protein